ncbi:MAG TPA: hypothetical protein PLG47_04150 [Candidatus Dojkabacteria bacterium]|nr:hypothetical protein [Candidatus Dojkabacteria bacterium]
MKTTQFQIIEGKKPILFSAPHACLHKRPLLSTAYRQAERFTDEIVIELCELTGSWGIYLSSEIKYDPNYNKIERNEYKKAVQDLCKKGKIEQFIDIHGMALGTDYDLGIYYPTRFLRSRSFAQEVREKINSGRLYGISTMLFRFLDNDEETLGEFVSGKMRIPSIQIEIARYLREDEDLRESFVENLAKIINERFV